MNKPVYSQYLRKETTRGERTLFRKNGTYHSCKVSAPYILRHIYAFLISCFSLLFTAIGEMCRANIIIHIKQVGKLKSRGREWHSHSQSWLLVEARLEVKSLDTKNSTGGFMFLSFLWFSFPILSIVLVLFALCLLCARSWKAWKTPCLCGWTKYMNFKEFKVSSRADNFLFILFL